MVITPHSLIGCLVGGKRKSLAAAFLAGTASHYLVDQVPHRDYPLEGVSGYASAAADAALAGALLVASGNFTARSLAAAAGGVFPDVLSVVSPGRRDPLTRFHDAVHTRYDTSTSASVAIQAAVVAAVFALLRRTR
jgi:hypothetical protein